MTLTITGGDRWTVPQGASEQQRMAIYTQLAGDCPSRCATCAFRLGTDANRSRLVLHLVEMCILAEDNAFMCHTGDDPPKRQCAGFAALRDRFLEMKR